MVCYQSDPSSSCPNMCQHTFLASESNIYTCFIYILVAYIERENHFLSLSKWFDIALVLRGKSDLVLQFKLLTPDSDIELFMPTANGFAKKIYQELGHG